MNFLDGTARANHHAKIHDFHLYILYNFCLYELFVVRNYGFIYVFLKKAVDINLEYGFFLIFYRKAVGNALYQAIFKSNYG